MNREFFILDAISVLLGSMVPSSTECGIKHLLESYEERPLARSEWVDVATDLRGWLQSSYPDLCGVMMPAVTEGRSLREWKSAIFLHFGFLIEIPEKEERERKRFVC